MLRLLLIAAVTFFVYLTLGGKSGKHGLAVICCVAFFGYIIALPLYRAKAQEGSHRDIAIDKELAQFNAKYGHYPKSLDEFAGKKTELGLESCKPCLRLAATKWDKWERKVHYEANDKGYVLVSYGEDGVPDGIDYWKVRREHRKKTICGFPTHDIVISDHGRHYVCGD